MLKKNRESFVYVYNCGVGCTCHERNMKKNLSTAPLRATLGTPRAGSPFRVLPQPSLEGMSALSTPSASRTQPHGWGPKSHPQNQFSFANEKWKMEVPHRWELRLAHLELDHLLGFSLNPLWKVWVLLAPQVLAELSHTVGARNPKPKNQFSFANEKWKMKVPHRWELRLAHLELDHPLGFSLNPLWKVWVLLAPQVLAELSHAVGARNPKPKNTVHSPRKSKLQNPKPKSQDPESKIPTPKSKASRRVEDTMGLKGLKWTYPGFNKITGPLKGPESFKLLKV